MNNTTTKHSYPTSSVCQPTLLTAQPSRREAEPRRRGLQWRDPRQVRSVPGAPAGQHPAPAVRLLGRPRPSRPPGQGKRRNPATPAQGSPARARVSGNSGGTEAEKLGCLRQAGGGGQGRPGAAATTHLYQRQARLAGRCQIRLHLLNQRQLALGPGGVGIRARCQEGLQGGGRGAWSRRSQSGSHGGPGEGAPPPATSGSTTHLSAGNNDEQ